jgi:hypothetical protein
MMKYERMNERYLKMLHTILCLRLCQSLLRGDAMY